MKKLAALFVFILALLVPNNIVAQEFLSLDVPPMRIQSKFVGGIELCVAPSRSITEESLTSTAFNFKAGYKYNSLYITGILGIEYLNNENFIPLGIEVRNTFSKNRWAPYAYIQSGYSLHLKRNIQSRYNTANYPQYEPALFLKAGVGYGLVTSLSEFYFSLGYLYHQLIETVVVQDGEIITDLTMNGATLTVGFNF